ncbi:N-acetylglucosamine-6-phosphate deacetylase [Oryzibacter oryziterrae]|uniref:N-acetylglucosamine-6-phosphate deacetylase n=1 Tax=Oryzibacter oryziterrae TaxID=2766474 RepID=UPI001F01B289|nr:N-acetylglucosamine-6-phosphate deacetylase [Oryzibacter oryziterrae]
MTLTAFTGADLFDGDRIVSGRTLLVEAGRVVGQCAPSEIPSAAQRVDLEGGLLTAGFIDAQVNGGGGVLLNDDRTPGAMGRIAAAHRRYGTTGLLPTLVTDTQAVTEQALDAAVAAAGVQAGVLGVHLEGPHLAPARKGAHPAHLMRPLDDTDVDRLIAARPAIGVLMVTLAVEQAPPRLIRRLADAGVIVSLGHTDAAYDAAMAAIDAGARGITHLFNAMSPLGHRAPGMVGAALNSGSVWCGMITDGHHVHPACLDLALRAKQGPGKCFIVTDAMPTVGVDATSFSLGGRLATRADGRLTFDDGTLAGADIDMAASLRFAVEHLQLSREEALRMTTLYPARFLRIDATRGSLQPGRIADMLLLDDGLRPRRVWLDGVECSDAPIG